MPEKSSKIRRGKIADYATPNKQGTLDSPGPYIGIVKWNIDPTRAGRLQVFIPDLGASDPEDRTSWSTVSYASPFRGKTQGHVASLSEYTQDGDWSSQATADEENSFQSYGFWFIPPDIGVRVLCIFVNGDLSQGYWFACINDSFDSYMTPGIGSAPASSYIWNPGQMRTHQKLQNYIQLATGEIPSRLPVSEATRSAQTTSGTTTTNSPSISNLDTVKKYPHIFQTLRAGIQGLCFDLTRGVTSTTSVRESPSNAYGITTPGRYWMMSDKTSSQQFLESPDSDMLLKNFRTGGHQLIMDDGTMEGLDQMFKIRSSKGNMILLDDTNEQIYIVNAQGTAWIEMTASGRIDIYSQGDFSLRSQGSVNIHAEQDFNVHARGNINVKSEKISNWQSQGNLNLKTSATATVFSQGNMNIGTQQTLDLSAQLNINAESHQDTNWKSQNYKLLATAGATLFGQGSVNIGATGSLNVYSTASLSLSSTGKVVISGTPLLQNTVPGTPVSAPTNAPATVTAPADIPLVSHPKTTQVGGRKTWWPEGTFQSIVARAPDHEPWKNHEVVTVETNKPNG